MRLIDADAFLERTRKDPLFPLVERYGLSGVIKYEPTVEAIPVDWLLNHIPNDEVMHEYNKKLIEYLIVGGEKKMKLLRLPDELQINPSRKSAKINIQLATNKDILTSVIETCKQYHRDCESCPYWLKNKFNCIWNAHKIIGKNVMAYWDIGEIEEKKI